MEYTRLKLDRELTPVNPFTAKYPSMKLIITKILA